MKAILLTPGFALTTLFAGLVIALPLESTNAKPGGLYTGLAKERKFNGVDIPGDTPVSVRIPNRKGKVTGVYNNNAAITGRVRKTIERNKGKKHIKRGNWTWFIGPGGAGAKGPFSIVIKKAGRKYRFKPSEKVNITTADDWNFKCTLSASK